MCLLILWIKRLDWEVYIAENRKGIKKGKRKIVRDVGRRDGPQGLEWL